MFEATLVCKLIGPAWRILFPKSVCLDTILSTVRRHETCNQPFLKILTPAESTANGELADFLPRDAVIPTMLRNAKRQLQRHRILQLAAT